MPFVFVSEPLQTSTVVSLAAGLLAVLILLICVCIYSKRAEKCCFASKYNFTQL